MFCAASARTLTRWILMLLLLVVLGSPAPAADDDPAVEDLRRRIAELEQRLAELEGGGGSDPASIDEIQRQLEILTEEIESLKLGEAAEPPPPDQRHGLGPAAAKVYARDRGVSVGGYGEMLFESFDSTREDGAPSGGLDRLDFLRLVLYFGYKFNDRILFNSELEFEHASTGKDGEVSVEFAYLDFLLRDAINVRAGMLLVPMGFVNELHEPPIFLGARRPLVESRLIPTTWRENGAGIHGDLGPVTYRSYVVTGMSAVANSSLDVSGFSAAGIRGGRTSGSKSPAEDLAWVTRFDWVGVEGLTLGGSFYTGGADQGATTTTGRPIDSTLRIWELHAEYRWRGLQTRGLFVDTTVGDVAGINDAQGFTGNESVGEQQSGWYLEAGYDVLAHLDTKQGVIPYLRHESLNTQEEVPAGFSANPANDVDVITIGVSYKPILNVAIKVDYNIVSNAADTGVNQVNAAVGFLF